MEQAKQLKESEKENGRLKRLVAELLLEKQVLREGGPEIILSPSSPWWKRPISSGTQSLVGEVWKLEPARRKSLLTNRTLPETFQDPPHEPKTEKNEVPAVLQTAQRPHTDFPAWFDASLLGSPGAVPSDRIAEAVADGNSIWSQPGTEGCLIKV